MKVFRLIALSIICVLAFCSCQKNYAELAQGKWEMDTDASYEEREGKRHYANDYYKGERVKKCVVTFADGILEINNEKEGGSSSNVETKTGKYHFDKDYFYVDGAAIHIIKLNGSRMVIEQSNDDELSHVELNRIEHKAFDSFLANIWYSLPLWIWIIIGVVVALLILLSWDDGGKVLLGIVVGLTVVVFSILYWDTFGVTIVGMAILGLFGWGVGSIIEAIFHR